MTVVVEPIKHHPQSTFELTFQLEGYEGEPIQIVLPDKHDVSAVSIAGQSEDVVLQTQTLFAKWASVFGGGAGLTDNGGSPALAPGNNGLIAIGGAATTTFAAIAGGVDVTVRATIVPPTGRIGRFA